MPFEELPHTADWSLRVWAESLEDLFMEAAKGMNSLAGIHLANSGRVERSFSVSAPDAESLLVSFLSELVYIAEHDCMAFNDFHIRIDHGVEGILNLTAKAAGAPILSLDKAIKAVTYHNLQINHTLRALEVEIVFDV